MTLRAVIFDRDGVLTYFDTRVVMTSLLAILPLSVEELTDRWWAWEHEHGVPTNAEEEARMFTLFWEHLADELELPAAQREQLHQFDYTTVFRAYPDARPAMEIAKVHGLRVGVLSNFDLANIEATLEAVGLLDLVDAACAAPVIGAEKPARAAYEITARKLGVPPAACLFFDDVPAYVAGARAAGLRAYHVDREREDHDLDAGSVRDLSAINILLQPLSQPYD
ncbi:MAG: HAD family hydrolase [Anaerolineales bacterium]